MISEITRGGGRLAGAQGLINAGDPAGSLARSSAYLGNVLDASDRAALGATAAS